MSGDDWGFDPWAKKGGDDGSGTMALDGDFASQAEDLARSRGNDSGRGRGGGRGRPEPPSRRPPASRGDSGRERRVWQEPTRGPAWAQGPNRHPVLLDRYEAVRVRYWHVREGDFIREGAPLVDFDLMDDMTTALSEVSGRVIRIMANMGGIVDPRSPAAIIDTSAVPPAAGPPPGRSPAPPQQRNYGPPPAQRGGPPQQQQGPPNYGRAPAPPPQQQYRPQHTPPPQHGHQPGPPSQWSTDQHRAPTPAPMQQWSPQQQHPQRGGPPAAPPPPRAAHPAPRAPQVAANNERTMALDGLADAAALLNRGGHAAPVAQAVGKLIVVHPGKPHDTYELFANKPVSLGRSLKNDIVVYDNKASRKHVIVTWKNGKAQVQDNKSTNGTVLNGRKISHAILNHGDAFQIGLVRIQYLGTRT